MADKDMEWLFSDGPGHKSAVNGFAQQTTNTNPTQSHQSMSSHFNQQESYADTYPQHSFHHGQHVQGEASQDDSAHEMHYYYPTEEAQQAQARTDGWGDPESTSSGGAAGFSMYPHSANYPYAAMGVADACTNGQQHPSDLYRQQAPTAAVGATATYGIDPRDLGNDRSDAPGDCLLLDAVLPPQYRQLLPYSHLNKVQSKVFDGVYHSDQNVAVAAPTGTGKTTIFELAIMRLMRLRGGEQYSCGLGSATTGTGETGEVVRPSFDGGKVVYLAPLRALAAEKFRDWSAMFSRIGLSVVCCTGDDGPGAGGTGEGGQARGGDDQDEGGGEKNAMGPSAAAAGRWMSKISRADIVITTPEKWDAITRRWTDNLGLIGQIALLAVDEVHLLGEDRGAALEAVVSRMRAVSRNPIMAQKGYPASCLRIVAVSATLPNLRDVARWIGAGPSSTFQFGEEYRPCKLEVKVMGYSSGPGSYGNSSGSGQGANGFMFEKYLDSRVAEVVAAHSKTRPTLVFCASRNGAKACAEQLVKDAARFNTGAVAAALSSQLASSSGSTAALMTVGWHRTAHSHAVCQETAKSLKDGRLADCVRRGTGYHSAGISTSDRAAIERLFLEGHLPILCTTTTLAMGVNLPAHLVVIKSTQAWRGSADGYKEYPKSTLLQMMGRAGRPQFDTSGVAYIMTHTSTAGLYRTIASGADPIESSLQPSLVEHLASEVCLATVTDTNAALQWLRSTFYYIRMSSAVADMAESASSSSSSSAGRPVPAGYGYDSVHQARTAAISKHYGLPMNTVNSQDRLDEHCTHQLASALYALAHATCIKIQAEPFLRCDYDMPTDRAADGTLLPPPQLQPGAAPRGWLALHGGWLPATVMDMREAFRAHPLRFTALGPARVMVRHYLRFDTVKLFGKAPRDLEVADALAHLCTAPELMSALSLRRDEKRVLREVKEKHGRALAGPKKTAGKITDVADKALQLAQAALARVVWTSSVPAKEGSGGTSAGARGKGMAGHNALHLGSDRNVAAGNLSFPLRTETNSVLDLLTRISKAFVAWTLCDEVLSPLLPVASSLSRALSNKTWHDATPERLLLQLPDMTEATAQGVVAIGAKSIEALQGPAYTAAALQAAAKKSHPWGQELKAAAARLLPRLGIAVDQIGMTTDTPGGKGAAILKITVTEISAPTLRLAAADTSGHQRSMAEFMARSSGSGAVGAAEDSDDLEDSSDDENGVQISLNQLKASSRGKAAVGAGSKRSRSTGATGKGKRKGPLGSHWYTLCVTTADKEAGLVYHRAYIKEPCTMTVTIPRPTVGPNVSVRLLHATYLGMDASLLITPTYPMVAVKKGSGMVEKARKTGLLQAASAAADSTTISPSPSVMSVTEATSHGHQSSPHTSSAAGADDAEMSNESLLARVDELLSGRAPSAPTPAAAAERSTTCTRQQALNVEKSSADDDSLSSSSGEEGDEDSDDGFVRRKKGGKGRTAPTTKRRAVGSGAPVLRWEDEPEAQAEAEPVTAQPGSSSYACTDVINVSVDAASSAADAGQPSTSTVAKVMTDADLDAFTAEVDAFLAGTGPLPAPTANKPSTSGAVAKPLAPAAPVAAKDPLLSGAIVSETRPLSPPVQQTSAQSIASKAEAPAQAQGTSSAVALTSSVHDTASVQGQTASLHAGSRLEQIKQQQQPAAAQVAPTPASLSTVPAAASAGGNAALDAWALLEELGLGLAPTPKQEVKPALTEQQMKAQKAREAWLATYGPGGSRHSTSQAQGATHTPAGQLVTPPKSLPDTPSGQADVTMSGTETSLAQQRQGQGLVVARVATLPDEMSAKQPSPLTAPGSGLDMWLKGAGAPKTASTASSASTGINSAPHASGPAEGEKQGKKGAKSADAQTSRLKGVTTGKAVQRAAAADKAGLALATWDDTAHKDEAMDAQGNTTSTDAGDARSGSVGAPKPALRVLAASYGSTAILVSDTVTQTKAGEGKGAGRSDTVASTAAAHPAEMGSSSSNSSDRVSGVPTAPPPAAGGPPCSHKCRDPVACGHACCREALSAASRAWKSAQVQAQGGKQQTAGAAALAANSSSKKTLSLLDSFAYAAQRAPNQETMQHQDLAMPLDTTASQHMPPPPATSEGHHSVQLSASMRATLSTLKPGSMVHMLQGVSASQGGGPIGAMPQGKGQGPRAAVSSGGKGSVEAQMRAMLAARERLSVSHLGSTWSHGHGGSTGMNVSMTGPVPGLHTTIMHPVERPGKSHLYSAFDAVASASAPLEDEGMGVDAGGYIAHSAELGVDAIMSQYEGASASGRVPATPSYVSFAGDRGAYRPPMGLRGTGTGIGGLGQGGTTSMTAPPIPDRQYISSLAASLQVEQRVKAEEARQRELARIGSAAASSFHVSSSLVRPAQTIAGTFGSTFAARGPGPLRQTTAANIEPAIAPKLNFSTASPPRTVQQRQGEGGGTSGVGAPEDDLSSLPEQNERPSDCQNAEDTMLQVHAQEEGIEGVKVDEASEPTPPPRKRPALAHLQAQVPVPSNEPTTRTGELPADMSQAIAAAFAMGAMMARQGGGPAVDAGAGMRTQTGTGVCVPPPHAGVMEAILKAMPWIAAGQAPQSAPAPALGALASPMRAMGGPSTAARQAQAHGDTGSVHARAQQCVRPDFTPPPAAPTRRKL